MTKKDYELIAGALRYCKPSKVAKPKGYADRLESWTGVLEVLSDRLLKENSRFDMRKFLLACGVLD